MDYIFVFIFGMVVGSFVNVVAYRVPLGRPVAGGRSKCPDCRAVIAWYDLIPVISFFALGARCRRCRARISWFYPFGEIASGLIFLAAFYYSEPFSLSYWLFTVFILEIFLALFLTDLKYLILPDIIILAGVTGAVFYGILEKLGLVQLSYHILSINNLTSALAFASIFYIFWLMSEGKWLGLGDAKFVGLIGLLFGYLGGLLVLYLAVAIGGIVGLTLLITHQADFKTKLPLGSFISLAAAAYVFTGPSLAQRLRLDLILR